MDQIDNERATVNELISFARQKGLDLEPFHHDSVFQMDRRWVFFWRRLDGIPASGPAEERAGTLHYNMQGAIAVLPSLLKESSNAFRGAWTEAGTFENIEQAFELLKAWLVDRKEIDELPPRKIRRCGI